MEFTSPVRLFKDNLWNYHLPVPLPIARHFIQDNQDRRVVCLLNGQVKIHAAIMSKGEEGHYLMLSKELRRKLGVEVGSAVHIQMEKDTSKYGMEMPEEFQEALYADPEGDQYFHDLTPGKQRTLIYQVAKPKSSQKRIEKAVVILEHLRKMQGKLDFKILNQDFKDYNRGAE